MTNYDIYYHNIKDSTGSTQKHEVKLPAIERRGVTVR